MTVPVSIIMSYGNRPKTFWRTLEGWSNLDYPDYEFIFMNDNGKPDDECSVLVEEFAKSHKVKHVFVNEFLNTNIIWNNGYKEASGDFIIFSMQDEIISNKQILHHLMDEYDNKRISVLPFYLTQLMTDVIDGVDWKHDPTLIETLPGFWTDKAVVNTTRVSAMLLSNISGQYRADWDYFGMFRDHQDGYLWIDQDVHLREMCLGKPSSTAKGVKCYHQAHQPAGVLRHRKGYVYKTEREARLLDPATEVG